MKLGIIAALPEEITTLTHLKIARGCTADISEHLTIAHAGTGPDNAGVAVQLLLEKKVDAIISWGCAAALKTGINPGSLAIPKQLITENKQTLSLQSPWYNHCHDYLSGHFTLCGETLAESSCLISSSAEKHTVHQATGAELLDMESIAIARSAQQAGIPCMVIRAIADPVEMDLPYAIQYALNAQGEIKLNKLLVYIATHPGEILALIRLGLHFNAAAKTLKSVAGHLETMAVNRLTVETSII